MINYCHFFQNLHFFHPIGTPGRANSLTFYSFKNITKINPNSDVRNRIFSIPRVPMAPKGAPTVAGTSQNWAQNASQSTQNPLQKCTGQPYIRTGNAKIADFIAVENQMKICIIKSHVFHFPVCVSGSNGRPRRPKNTENWSKNCKFFFKNRVGSTARPSGRVGRCPWAFLRALDLLPSFASASAAHTRACAVAWPNSPYCAVGVRLPAPSAEIVRRKLSKMRKSTRRGKRPFSAARTS